MPCHIDSAIWAAQQAQAQGNEDSWLFFNSYQTRASILYNLGQVDSAWYYQQLGYEMELEDLQQSNQAKVLEIMARYQDEKKAQKIEEQSLLLRYEKKQRNTLWSIIGLILISSALLVYFNIRLRKANHISRKQTLAIANANRDLGLALEQQMILQGEVYHRVKNNLQVIISLLELQKEDVSDPMAQKSLDSMSNRIYSMAAIHEILYLQDHSESVPVIDYTETLCKHFAAFSDDKLRPRFHLDIDDLTFGLETLMPLGIILNELMTNSLKYASEDKKRLEMGISLKPKGTGYHLSYWDNGPGFPQGELKNRTGGLGSYLLTSMTRQLKGNMESWNQNGAVINIFFHEKLTSHAHEHLSHLNR